MNVSEAAADWLLRSGLVSPRSAPGQWPSAFSWAFTIAASGVVVAVNGNKVAGAGVLNDGWRRAG